MGGKAAPGRGPPRPRCERLLPTFGEGTEAPVPAGRVRFDQDEGLPRGEKHHVRFSVEGRCAARGRSTRPLARAGSSDGFGASSACVPRTGSGGPKKIRFGAIPRGGCRRGKGWRRGGDRVRSPPEPDHRRGGPGRRPKYALREAAPLPPEVRRLSPSGCGCAGTGRAGLRPALT
jgi:hypothetical protein